MTMEDKEVYRFDGSDDLYDKEGNKLVKICKICGKRFSSGKALGGHIRIHFAQLKPLDPPKKVVLINQKKKLTILMNHDCDGEKIKNPKNNYECLCCHKSFDSQKALYGHMRSHPEREYRGVVPPPLSSSSPPIHQNNSSSNNSTLSQDEVLKKMNDDDLIKVCDDEDDDDDDDDDELVSDAPMRWLCTGKRGRKTTLVSTNSSGFCSSVSSSEDEDERMNAALVLMSLRNAGKYYDDDNVDDDVRKTKKHKQIKKLGDLDEAGPSNRDDRYKCSTCNKSFSSHQALGGHRSSHRKPVVISESKFEAAEVEGEHEVDIGSHQCELCGKIFETGQALGGHKRCHRMTTYIDDAPLVVQAVPLVESTQQQQAVAAPDTAPVMFNFDLNEPAFADDEYM